MSAPPLPEVFGNYALVDFVEVVAPTAVSWLPQTAGWAWLGVAILVLLLRYLVQRVRHWYRNRYRREAAGRLTQLASSTDHDTWLVELNRLLKLTALAAYSREQVARLSGTDWVEFLNRQCAAPPFNAELGTLLAQGTYNNTLLSQTKQQALLAAAQHWVSNHQEPDHV